MHETTNRCNGHIQVSPAGKTTKRDRKGCKKGKIEAIMKNNMGSTKQKVHMDSIFKKKTKLLASTNHFGSSGSVVKGEVDDPYAFTDSEPQAVGLYSGGNSCCLSLPRKGTVFISNNCHSSTPVSCSSVSSGIGVSGCSVSGGNDELKINKTVAASYRSNKHSAGVDGSSKTMNQLQADIARNKVIVKRRRIVYQHQLSSQEDVKPWSEPNSNSARTFAKVSIPAKRLHRQTTWQRERRSRHEALQRIQEAQLQAVDVKRDLFPLGLDVSESEDDTEDSHEVYQRHWFMGFNGEGGFSVRGRESRLTQLRSELRRRLRQVWRGIERRGEPPPDLVQAVVAAARTQPTATALLVNPRMVVNHSKQSRAKVSMLGVKQCSLCQRRALPCTRHCTQHIMYNVDQLLFEYCTAKLDDNTQCRIPVFDISHQMPLCPKHAGKGQNKDSKHFNDAPKKSRKKNKTSTLTRSNKRGKKKKKKPSSMEATLHLSRSDSMLSEKVSISPVRLNRNDGSNVQPPVIASSLSPVSSSAVSTLSQVQHVPIQVPISQVEIQIQLEDVVEGVPEEEVLAIDSLDPAELASHASRLLEDHELTNMLNIPPDAFNDLFTEDKNGEYEPTREETEELERALEAVDKDVRSLEQRMTGNMPLSLTLPLPLETMTTLLDDPGVAVSGVFGGYPNGFAPVQTDLRHS